MFCGFRIVYTIQGEIMLIYTTQVRLKKSFLLFFFGGGHVETQHPAPAILLYMATDRQM